jgi:hypothetical protein
MRSSQRRFTADAPIEPWEFDLIRKVARAFRTTEREDLEAELARKTLQLKRKEPTEIRDWKAYLAKFLFNKASNWIRDSRVKENKIAPPGAASEESRSHRLEPLTRSTSEACKR